MSTPRINWLLLVLAVGFICMFVKYTFNSSQYYCLGHNEDTHQTDTLKLENVLGHLPRDLQVSVGSWLLSFQPNIQDEFDVLVANKVSADDPLMVAHTRKVIVPPSKHGQIKLNNKPYSQTPQSKEILSILQNQRNGFFIEAGAANGERSSNSLHLELHFGWKGLLVEMDPYWYLMTIAKNRRAHTLNACISTTTSPVRLLMQASAGGLGKVGGKKGTPVPCYPLYSMLLALNQTRVDFFSLDVEGNELPILKTIPFDKLDIRTFAIEDKGSSAELKAFMESKGYIAHKHIKTQDLKLAVYVDDTIFVKKS